MLILDPPGTRRLGELARQAPRLASPATVSANPVHAVVTPDDPDRVDRPFDAERPLFDRPSLATDQDGHLAAVPEPSSVVTVGMAAGLGLGYARRKRKRASA